MWLFLKKKKKEKEREKDHPAMGQGGSIKQQHKQVDPEVTFTETSAGFGSGGEHTAGVEGVLFIIYLFKIPASPSTWIRQLVSVFVEQPCIEYSV